MENCKDLIRMNSEKNITDALQVQAKGQRGYWTPEGKMELNKGIAKFIIT